MRWIATSVEIFEHPILRRNEPFDRVSAFQWLIANAAWKPHRTRNGGKVITLERGQCLAGLEHLAKVWRWSVKKVRIFLADLVSEKMIEKGTPGGNGAAVITICNYEKYQTPGQAEGQDEGQERGKSGASGGQEKGNTVPGTTFTTTSPKIDSSLLASSSEDAARERASEKFDLREVNALAAKLATIIDPDSCDDDGAREAVERALENHGLEKVRQGLADFAAKAQVLSFANFEKFCANVSRIRHVAASHPQSSAWANSPYGRQAAAARAKGTIQ